MSVAGRDRAHRIIESLAVALTSAGFPRMPARVFSALLCDEDGRMTAAELVELLQTSPASVSAAAKYLDQVGLVSREREPGSRRDIFVVNPDTWHGTMLRKEAAYGPIIRSLADTERELGPQSVAGRRVAESRELIEFIGDEMDRIRETWERRRAARGH